jgi:N-acetylglucosamine-1-phosphate transferase gamma subunit
MASDVFTCGFCCYFTAISITISCLLASCNVKAKQVSMKIVDEPSNLGLYNPYQAESHTDVLTARVLASNLSGPVHLKTLYGKCFTKIDETYKYEFCPFFNLTQHEQSLRWNPYSGILGVWQEWEIINNTFTAMIMREGDSCGALYRSTKVIMKCGRKNEIDKVSEPETCQYELEFFTPLVCHAHSMLVYPTLSKELRQRWDMIETRLVNEELTQKGYDKRLHKLFEDASLQLHEDKVKQLSQLAKEKEARTAKHDVGDFDTLDKCTEEYRKMKDEIEGLRTLLHMYQGQNNTHAGMRDHMADRDKYEMYHYDD